MVHGSVPRFTQSCSVACCTSTSPARSEERRVGKECRYWRDWSSDVCSSDLLLLCTRRIVLRQRLAQPEAEQEASPPHAAPSHRAPPASPARARRRWCTAPCRGSPSRAASPAAPAHLLRDRKSVV